MSLKGKRIFVSGGSGVIGKELVLKLYREEAIILVGDLKSKPFDWPSDIHYRQGDLNYITKEEIESFAPQYFFHLAATFERSIETYEFWEENHWNNVRLSTYLMTILKDCESLEKVIFASSYLIYNPELYFFTEPQKNARSLRESDPIYPRNLTGVAKLNHEIELSFLNNFKAEQFRTVSARIFRSYGKNSRDIISRWIRALLRGESITVYRKEGMFDYIFAGEVAEGLLRLARHPQANGIYNLGNNNARGISEVLDVLKKHFPDMKTMEADTDIPYEASQADMDYTFKILKWKPSVQIEEAIPIIIKHEKECGYHEENEHIKFNVLVTSISKKVPMLKAIKTACRKVSPNVMVIGGDVNPGCIGKWFVDKFWEMPGIDDLGEDQILQFCRDNNIKVIIPTRDGELLYWATLSHKLKKNGIFVMISHPDAVMKSIDKSLFYEFLQKAHLPGIKTVNNIQLLDCDRFVVKERFGAGSKSIGLNLTREIAIEHSRKLSDPVFQQFINGKEFTIDIYNTMSARNKAVVVRSRDLIVSGESQITRAVKDEQLEKIAKEFSEKLPLIGHGNLQLIVDENRKCHIIEFNCRFGGASTLSVFCGMDSFYWFLLESLGNDPEKIPVILNPVNKIQIRYPDDLIVYDPDF